MLNRLQYNRYASVVAIESTSKLDDEQWLAYWIIYSFLTLMEMVLQPLLEWSVEVLDFPFFFLFNYKVYVFLVPCFLSSLKFLAEMKENLLVKKKLTSV